MNNTLSGCSVLVVEDEALLAWMLETMLTSLGCKVVGTATRIDQALVLIEKLEVLDLVLLDFSLLGQKSYPVADVLVERNIPFIFSTGYNRDNFPEKYKNMPMLQKPFSEAELANALIGILMPDDLKRRSG